MKAEELKNKIESLEKEIPKLEKEASDPDIINNQSKLRDITKKLSKYQEELAILKEWDKAKRQLKETNDLIETESNEELIQMAKDDIEALEITEQNVEKKWEELHQGPSTKDIKACILEIRAGTGGEESNLFASDLFRMYAKYAESNGWKVGILSKNQTGTGGFKEIIAEVKGDEAYHSLQYENGVHRVQRIPVTESSGRIHTSAASVVVFPLQEEEDVEIDPNDLKIDAYRSSGPGGQSVNTTDSAIRITHIPTGTVVSCQDEKSQHKNKKKAMSILASRLASLHEEEQEEELSEVRKSAIKTGDRSAKIRTYNFPQNRITDHRIKKSWHNLKSVIDGDLDQVIETLHEKM